MEFFFRLVKRNNSYMTRDRSAIIANYIYNCKNSKPYVSFLPDKEIDCLLVVIL